jgi:hypothetical protein
MEWEYKLRAHQVDEMEVYSKCRGTVYRAFKASSAVNVSERMCCTPGWDVCDILYFEESLPLQENFAAVMVIISCQ